MFNYNNFIKNPARNNKTFYYINDIYVCLDKNNKYLVSQKFNKYNKSLININHNKIKKKFFVFRDNKKSA